MCEMRMAVLASVLAGLLLLAALPTSASAGLAGFSYQREIVIQENSGETLRDYQVLVALAGSDFPEEAEADGGDIRFTGADGHELSYWIEEFDVGSKRAKIWVKVPSIPANGEAGVTMWYGNPSAGSESDGEAVFEFFDDFEDGTIDTKKWFATSEVTEIHGILFLPPGNYVTGKSSYSLGYSLMTKAELVTQNQYEWIGWEEDGRTNAPENIYFTGIGQHRDTSTTWLWGGNNVNYCDYNFGSYYNGYHVFEVARLGVDDVFYIDHGLFYNNVLYPSKTSRHPIFSTYEAGRLNVDWCAIRRYTSPEPTITLAPPAPATHTTLSITKSPSPHSIRQFQETTITLSIENSGTTDATDIEITDAIHPSFDLVSGDFPNPKRYDLIRPGETRDIQYTITAKESGTFTLDPATVTYADEDGNIQEAKSEPVSIKVIPSTEGGTSGGTSRSNPSISTASVQLHGEKTNVVLGEDILLKLSAVNLITKPTMQVQVIIIPPSGMSVTSSAFAKTGAGQYTTTYELEPGTGKDIEVAIRSNQVGDFDVNGRIIYYFGDDREDAEDHTLTLPITVRAEAEPGVDQTERVGIEGIEYARIRGGGCSHLAACSTSGAEAITCSQILLSKICHNT